jgi:hypothetical protein
VDVTSGSERTARGARPTQRFGTIVVVGGGCYGSYFVRQLGRAQRAGAIEWARLIVVDRDPACPVAMLPTGERPPSLEVATAEWEPFFARFLGQAAHEPAAHGGAHPGAHSGAHLMDAIVPSPLMPHLMAGWLLSRAAERWPGRRMTIQPLGGSPPVPWQRAGDDGTHYVSFAEWMCPINCIEPERCPHTRGERSWSMPVALAHYADAEAKAGRPLEGPYVFRCLHRAYGVGMLDVADIVAADAAIARRGEAGPASFLVGTVSHCHGALRRLELSD